jgi:hypothetical protein
MRRIYSINLSVTGEMEEGQITDRMDSDPTYEKLVAIDIIRKGIAEGNFAIKDLTYIVQLENEIK